MTEILIRRDEPVPGLEVGDPWPDTVPLAGPRAEFRAWSVCLSCGEFGLHWLEPVNAGPPRVVKVYERPENSITYDAWGYPGLARFDYGPPTWEYLVERDLRTAEVMRECQACGSRWPEW